MSAGGTYAELLLAGQWRGDAARFYLGRGENERRAMTDIPIEGSDDEPSKLSVSLFFPPSSLSRGSRDVLPLATSAREGALGVRSELWAEVHLDMLV